jgi:hypothetical protein
VSSPEREFRFEEIVTASWEWNEINSLERTAHRMDEERPRRSGRGLLGLRCEGCGRRIGGPFMATRVGPLCPACSMSGW